MGVIEHNGVTYHLEELDSTLINKIRKKRSVEEEESVFIIYPIKNQRSAGKIC